MQIGIKEGIEALAQPIPAQAAFMQGHGKSTLKVRTIKLSIRARSRGSGVVIYVEHSTRSYTADTDIHEFLITISYQILNKQFIKQNIFQQYNFVWLCRQSTREE